MTELAYETITEAGSSVTVQKTSPDSFMLIVDGAYGTSSVSLDRAEVKEIMRALRVLLK